MPPWQLPYNCIDSFCVTVNGDVLSVRARSSHIAVKDELLDLDLGALHYFKNMCSTEFSVPRDNAKSFPRRGGSLLMHHGRPQ